jgi:hypothetical protein
MFSYNTVQKLLTKISKDTLVTEMENMSLAGILSSQLIYHQYILKDNFRPSVSRLNNCQVIHEKNPIYS